MFLEGNKAQIMQSIINRILQTPSTQNMYVTH